MDMSKKGKSVTNEATVLRFIYGPNAAKKIARDFSVAVRTAKLWLSGRFPVARREELAAHIRTRLDERDELSAAIRRQWAGGSGEEKNGSVDRRHAVAPRDEADTMGR